MADEEIRIDILINDGGTIQKIDNLRQRMETFKGFAKQFAKDTGDTLEVAFQSLKDTGLDNLEKEIKDIQKEIKVLKDVEKGLIDRAAIKDAENRIRQLKKAQSELRVVASQSFREAKKEAREYVRVLTNLSKIDLDASTKEIKEQGDALEEVGDETEEVQGGIQGLINGFKDLGAAGKIITGIFGVGLIQAIRQVIDVFKEAITASLDFQQSLFTLEVAIRGLQRVGLDTTIEGWDRRLEDLKKIFPIFSKKEFTDAASLAALMTREFGFTEAQIADLVKQSAILSEITGKDLNEAVRGVTFAIGSGYFESLQRAGINISRQVVANKALELGYEAVYNELEPVIRASITYAVIQDNLNAIQEDAGKIVEKTKGAVLRLNASWKDFLITLGQVVTESETTKEAVEGLARSVELLTEALELLNSLSDEEDEAGLPKFFAFMIGLAPRTEELEAFNEQLEIFVNWIKEMQGAREPILDDLVDEDALEALEKFEIGGVEFSEEEYQEIVDATVELAEEIEKIEEESFKRRQDALDKFQDESTDKFQAHIQKILDIQQDLNRKLADITLKAEQRTSDAIANNAFRIQEVIRKAAFRREDAERKFREREISSERKFQEKLRQLRENFLLDLEDAVRERDARQIIRLTRQFNLRRTQMVREEKLNKDDRTNQFQEELRQIERQKQERLRQLAVEHQRRLEDIARQAERERAQARIDAERRRAEENARFEREKEDRKARLEETLNAIDEGTQERINAVIQGLKDEFDLSEKQLDAISTLYENAYGPDGRIDRAVAYTIARLQQLAQFMNMLRTSMGTVPFPEGTRRFEHEFDNAGGQAEGGTIIARKPTVAVFGEAGPEMATFTPLNKLGSNGRAAITPMDAGNMPRNGHIKLEMLLSPDLEARVVDNTLGEIADVNFAIERARK